MTLRQLLSNQADEIVHRFVAALRAGVPASHELPRSLLVDHIPVFLSELAEELVAPPAARHHALLRGRSRRRRLSASKAGGAATICRPWCESTAS